MTMNFLKKNRKPDDIRKQTSNPSDAIHEMVAEYNAEHAKTFWYTEEETKQLCKMMSEMSDADFEIWWNSVKKQ